MVHVGVVWISETISQSETRFSKLHRVSEHQALNSIGVETVVEILEDLSEGGVLIRISLPERVVGEDEESHGTVVKHDLSINQALRFDKL